MLKRRTWEHIIADLSVNHFERFALLRGHVVDRVVIDYGYDLIFRTFNEGEIEPGFLFVQLKASDHPDYIFDGQSVSIRIDPRDRIAWQLETVPVILVVYDASRDRAYWVHVQSLPSEGRATVHIPVRQTVSEEAIEEMHRLKTASQGGL